MVNPDFQYCPLPLGFTDSIEGGAWNYTVTVNSTSVERGQTIQLVARLTNCENCGNITIGNFVEPFIDPVVYSTNGTMLWSWNPTETTYSNFVFPGGQTITQTVDIPTLSFQAGYNYQLTVVPAFVTIGEGNVNTVTLQFSVTPPANTTTSTSTATQTTTITSTAPCPSGATCASFAYTPTGQVQVLFVHATQFVCQNCGAVNGQSYLAFQVALENVGNSSIYIAGGTGELSVSIPANSSVIRAVSTEVCAGTFTIIELGQGQNYTLGGPPCDNGLDYQLVQAGSVNVSFSFNWTTSANSSNFPDKTTIMAAFTFA